jgi:Zn-dependent protease with chaperone function
MEGEQNAYLLRKIEFNAKNKVNHLRKQLFCSQHTAPFFFGSHPLTPKEKPLVSASSEALQ